MAKMAKDAVMRTTAPVLAAMLVGLPVLAIGDWQAAAASAIAAAVLTRLTQAIAPAPQPVPVRVRNRRRY